MARYFLFRACRLAVEPPKTPLQGGGGYRQLLLKVCLKNGLSHYAQAIFEPNLFLYKYPNISQTQFILHTYLPMKMGQSVPERQHIKFRCWGIMQNKAYNNVI
jgi:hypothetical protein